jgi:hypothetical protein
MFCVLENAADEELLRRGLTNGHVIIGRSRPDYAAKTRIRTVGGLEANPFGEKPVPWWRRLHRSRKGRAPKRYAAVAGAMGPMGGLFITSGDGLDRPARVALVAGLTLLPPSLVEVWWRRRERRKADRLLVLPE